MVDLLVYVALGASLVSLGSLVVLVRYLPVLQQASKAYVESSDLISYMIKELNERASSQDRRLADAQVKLDTLEDRWLRTGWMVSQAPVSYPPPAPIQTPMIGESLTPIIRRRQQPAKSSVELEDQGRMLDHSDSTMPTRIEVLVLKSLVGRRLTAPDVKGVLGSSREHAARIMKSLADKGLVIRDASKKPYSYELSDIGRDMVTGNPLHGL